MHNTKTRNGGFTLIEISIVFLIVALLLGAGLTAFSTQAEIQKAKDAQKLLDEAKEALLGYTAATQRLPCPATAASNGVEAPVGGGGAAGCTASFTGFLPAQTLGMTGNSGGYLIDPWGNRIRYAVTRANNNAATRQGEIGTVGVAIFTPNIAICSTSTGASANDCSGAATRLTNTAVAVIFSLGSVAAARGNDENANLDNNRVFVSLPPTNTGNPTPPPNGEFDDIVTWISQPVLYNAMYQNGSLP